MFGTCFGFILIKSELDLTVVFVVRQLQEEVQDADEGGELVGHLELTAERNPEVHISLQSGILHTTHTSTTRSQETLLLICV